MVDAKGSTHTASKSKNSDLFWANCGGGGGNFGALLAGRGGGSVAGSAADQRLLDEHVCGLCGAAVPREVATFSRLPAPPAWHTHTRAAGIITQFKVKTVALPAKVTVVEAGIRECRCCWPRLLPVDARALL